MNNSDRRARLDALFHAHAAEVRAYAHWRIDTSLVDDVVSEVFLIAWRRLDDVPDDALPWLLACARRVLANQRRSVRRVAALRERLLRERTMPSPDISADRLLGCALSALNDRDRDLLLLIAWDGLTPAQAAKVLGCSSNALSVRLHRARRRLAASVARLARDITTPELTEHVND
jgi:RNA polymerase sigma factor (sigma-70 family)